MGEWDPRRAPSSVYLEECHPCGRWGTAFSPVRVAAAAGMGEVVPRDVPAISEVDCGCACPTSGIGGGGHHGQSGLSGGGGRSGTAAMLFFPCAGNAFPLARRLTRSCLSCCHCLAYYFCMCFTRCLRPVSHWCAHLMAHFFFTPFSLACARRSLKEFATFFSKTLAKRVPAGGRSTVEHHEYLCHVHSRSNGLVAVALCDREYPSRVAFTLLSKVTDDFLAAFPVESSWHSVRHDGSGSSHTPALSFPALDAIIEKYQDPAQADPIMKIQKDLDDTKVILHKTIDGVLERGVKLDSLVEKSNDLSLQSKMFYKQAKSQNSCCGMM